MKKIGVVIIAIIGLMMVESCGSQEGARAPLPSIVGARGEVLIVCDDAIWKSEVGDTLRDALMMPYHVLPQMHMETFEPMFDLVQKTKEDFYSHGAGLGTSPIFCGLFIKKERQSDF